MNVMVIRNSFSINKWFNNLFSTADHIIHTIGYARTAAELSRLGFHEEARRCKELMLDIKKSKES